MDSSAQPALSRRSLALAAILFLWMAVGAGRLVQLQIFHYGEFVSRATRQQQRTIDIDARRGIIYDRNFRELAMSVSVDSVYAVPSEIPSPETTVQLLGRVLKVDSQELLARMKGSRSFCWVKRRVDNLEAERVRSMNLKGIYFYKEPKRFYPKRELAAHVLGYVGMDNKGLAGIEQELDRQIHGRPGKLLIQTDARHHWYGRAERPAEPGENVVLTIDEKIQYIVERELDAAMETTHALAGTVIVMNPNTGEVLAMANRPTFNPNTYSQMPPEAWMNRAVAASYEPGSTFKIVTVAGALEERLTRPDEVLDCQMGSINVFGRLIHDHKAYGMLTVSQVIQNSSDVGAIKLGLRLGDDRMYRYMRAFGFGAPTGIELPGEAKGLTRPPERWSKVSIGAISMGQEVGVTAMQLVTAVSAIATNGRRLRPHIIRESFRQNPSTQHSGLLFAAARTSEETVSGQQMVSPETAAAMKAMLQQVVLAGTGPKAQLNGWSSAGKTGTAQKADPVHGGYSKTDYIASFTGFAPINNPALSMVVVLDSARGLHQGGQVAAPVFKKVMEQVLAYLDVPRDLPTRPEKGQPQIDVAQVSDAPEDTTVGIPPAPPASPAAAPDQTMIVDLEGAPVTPEFLGKSVRAVAEQALALGLDVEMVGVGLARNQDPPPGSRLTPGTRITVRFSRN